MYAHPFSADYWRDASREVRDLRKLLFSALMIALCIVLAQVPSVPLFGGAKVTWGFLARSVCAWVCGPVLGLLYLATFWSGFSAAMTIVDFIIAVPMKPDENGNIWL